MEPTPEMLTQTQVLNALRSVIDPELKRNVVDLNMVRDIKIEDRSIHLALYLTTLACPLADHLANRIRRALMALPEIDRVLLDVKEMSNHEAAQLFTQLRARNNDPTKHKVREGISLHVRFATNDAPARAQTPSVRTIHHVIGVTSGKGGVGKSLLTGLLAVALQRQGYSVGIFDVDITGASMPTLFGLNGKRMKKTPEGIIPARTANGIRIVSANFMLPRPDHPVAWRGAKIAQLITDLWKEIVWGPLDVLLFDFPPGTSDTHLTVMMELPLDGLLMVTTPQALSSLMVRKAIALCQNMNIPMLGVIENMSYFRCPDTGVRHAIFGPSHAQEVCASAGAPLLAQLPMDPDLAQAADAGKLETFRFPIADGLAQSMMFTLTSRSQT